LTVGVVVVTHRNANLAADAVRCVATEIPLEHRVVVVNAPDLCDQDDLAALGDLVGRLICNRDPVGYGANLNQGVRALPDVVAAALLLNDDAFVQPGALAGLVRCVGGDVGLVGGLVRDAQRRAVPSAFRFPSVASELVSLTLLPEPFRTRLAHRCVLSVASDVSAPVDWVLGAAMLVRLDAFDGVSGFDERFFLYSEETDLARRLSLAGWRCVLEPRAEVVHLGESSTQSLRYRAMVREARGLYVRIHWSQWERITFEILLAGVLSWNLGYVLVRAMLRRGTLRENIALWRTYAASRPLGVLGRGD
jgi:N-acetylglucosaminyl-diphospho-decaprenol L-rhamnosyltransferase